ncbi:uncharacterized protein BO97DRAFT_410767 [Aspergillus homomorphus CBS 101889]|uniref:Uncharacterized protein n=1 Tax=Aspergillus homomorphus (strain CBS 101889) TaxID=1450537 RepID=A0A395I8J9_ASPHC|nr:hypothetical protein BO97DRAFT_410767 [Aspergillus homomorphus CBS 101889]RAL16371.1 hypothetical protein BO97DRAFT_410767 [Aspergillus homomorphus CBS 101889]
MFFLVLACLGFSWVVVHFAINTTPATGVCRVAPRVKLGQWYYTETIGKKQFRAQIDACSSYTSIFSYLDLNESPCSHSYVPKLDATYVSTTTSHVHDTEQKPATAGKPEAAIRWPRDAGWSHEPNILQATTASPSPRNLRLTAPLPKIRIRWSFREKRQIPFPEV